MSYQIEDRYQLQYFTGTQASIWIGTEWVAECFGISFSATQNIIPIFGYASTTFDAVAKGRVLVQGSFEVNFIDEGYLYYVLHKTNAEKIRDPGAPNVSQQLLTGEPPTANSMAVDRLLMLRAREKQSSDQIKDQITLEAMRDLMSVPIGTLDRVIRDLDIQRQADKDAGVRNKAKSIIYDIVPFNLQGIFGHPELTDEVTEKKLLNCFLVSNEMIVSVNDQPQRERYSFIGQIHK